MIKIAHLTSAHPANDARIFHKECRTLAAAGYEVTLVAPHDHDETLGGVRIRSVPRPTSRADRYLRTVWHVYRAALSLDASVYHFHDIELIPVGVLLRCAGKAVVYDVHEDVPGDILSKDYIPERARPPLALAAKITLGVSGAVFDRIVTATPAIARRFPKRKTVVLQNFAMLDEWDDAKVIPYAERDSVIAYVGGITTIRGIREILTAISLLPSSWSPRLTLAGSFLPLDLEDEVRKHSAWSQVDFLGLRPRAELAQILGRARVGLVLFHPVPNHVEAQPNKLYEYMSAGLPIVASDFPLWREFIERNRCGIVVDPLNPRAVAQAIEWMLEHEAEAEAMGARGRAAVEKHYSWDAEAAKLIELYDGVVAERKAELD